MRLQWLLTSMIALVTVVLLAMTSLVLIGYYEETAHPDVQQLLIQGMQTRAILCMVLGVFVAFVTGLFFARMVKRPIKTMIEAASQLVQGNASYGTGETKITELRQLFHSFQRLQAELEQRDNAMSVLNEDFDARLEEEKHELVESRDQLLQSQKIAAVTALGAGIAHEINNPLTSVIGLSQVMMTKARKEGNGEEVELLRIVETEALRMKGIVRTLLTFSQDYAGEGFSPVHVCEVLDEAIEFVDSAANKNQIEIVREYVGDMPKIFGNKTQLQQVFLHLLNNSCIAMPNGGQLSLSTTCTDGQLVKVCVADTGKGIAPENMEKIFEPFFTTKDNWRGEGLGLTVAFRIIEQHHGTIKASSELGKGTTMAITLPAAKRGAHLV